MLGKGTSLATARTPRSPRAIGSARDSDLYASSFGQSSLLNPSSKTRSTCESFPSNSSNSGASPLPITAHRLSETIRTSRAPAALCLKLSVPFLSMLNAWWACLTVETAMLLLPNSDTRRSNNPVFPEFFQPMIANTFKAAIRFPGRNRPGRRPVPNCWRKAVRQLSLADARVQGLPAC